MEKTALSKAQINALEYVHNQSLLKAEIHRENLNKILISENDPLLLDSILQWISTNSKITVNFHPDRFSNTEKTVIESLIEDGIYKSQFQTGISNGGLTAFPGGDRDKWEERMFGRSYHTNEKNDKREEIPEDSKIAKETEKEREERERRERPRYGGLNIFNYNDGACPRFGSCHFVLKSHVLQFSSFSFGDSVSEPEHVGLINSFSPVLSALMESIHFHSMALGMKIDIIQFLNLVSGKERVKRVKGRAIDSYIEAQIHSIINLSTSVDSIVADPSFQGTEVENQLKQLSQKYKIELKYNDGYKLSIKEFPENLRGPRVPLLAQRIANLYNVDIITPAILGKAAQSVLLNPTAWIDWDSPAECLQGIKYLWHILVILG